MPSEVSPSLNATEINWLNGMARTRATRCDTRRPLKSANTAAVQTKGSLHSYFRSLVNRERQLTEADHGQPVIVEANDRPKCGKRQALFSAAQLPNDIKRTDHTGEYSRSIYHE